MCAQNESSESIRNRHRNVAESVLPETTKLFINGQWKDGEGDESLIDRNPTTNDELAAVPAGTAADIDSAVNAAWNAFEREWKETDAVSRQQVLLNVADIVEEHSEELAKLETLDNGKPIIEARADMATVIDQFRYFAGVGRSNENVALSNQERMGHTIQEPYGVVGQIIPWNFPLSMASWKLAPALAAGNCIVLKPAEDTPLSILKLMDLVDGIIPDGVLNVVPGYGPEAGDALSSHPDIEKLAFTGSTNVGREIMRNAAENIVDVTLELGGKSPVIVFPDADMDKAIDVVDFAIFANAGECCTAGSRLFLHEDIEEKFIDAFVDRVENLQCGDPLLESTDLGPQISTDELDSTLEYVRNAVSDGGSVVAGGDAVSSEELTHGHFMEPTVICDLPHNHVAVQEEIFGPVLEVFSWTEYDEMISLANDVKYGLSSSVVTQDINKAYETAKDIEAGYVWINQHHDVPSGLPFGGYKQSGIGRELAQETLNAYQQTKTINVGL